MSRFKGVGVRIVVLMAFVCSSLFSHAQLYSLTSSDYFIYFDSDSYEISSEQVDSLMKKIYEIGSTNIKEIYVEGHTDSFASDAYNAILASNRADAAVRALEQIGVPRRFIKTESFGESKLISEDQRTNRRAKIFFVYETDKKSKLDPPKFIVIKTIDKKTKRPIRASVGFDYKGQEMRFSSTGSSGVSEAFSMLGEELEVSASAFNYLSEYLVVPIEDIDKPNKELSFRRAKAINDYLVVSGVSQKRLTYKGMSNTRMKFKLPMSRAEEDQNKRVEIYTLKAI